MRFFKTILATTALAVAVFLGGIAVPASVQAQTAGPLPDRGDTIQRSTGKLIDFTGGNSTTTTYDTFDFGFTSDLVRLCAYPGSAVVYVRMANAVTTSPTEMASALVGQRATAPVSTSAAFITGAAVAGETINRALPLASFAVSPATGWTNNAGGIGKDCTTFPFRSPGIVAHIVSGVATVEAWAVSR